MAIVPICQMPRKFKYFIQYKILKISEFSLPTCLSAIRSSSSASATKVIAKTVVLMKVYPLHYGLSLNTPFHEFLSFLETRRERKETND